MISSARDTARFETLAREALGTDVLILSTGRVGAVRVDLRSDQRILVGPALRPVEWVIR